MLVIFDLVVNDGVISDAISKTIVGGVNIQYIKTSQGFALKLTSNNAYARFTDLHVPNVKSIYLSTYLDTLPSNWQIFFTIFSADETYKQDLLILPDGKLYWNTGDGTSNPFLTSSGSNVALQPGKWYNIVILDKYNNFGKVEIYINGTYSGSANYKHPTKPLTQLNLCNYGQSNELSYGLTCGYIAKLRIYEELLTQQYITKLATKHNFSNYDRLFKRIYFINSIEDHQNNNYYINTLEKPHLNTVSYSLYETKQNLIDEFDLFDLHAWNNTKFNYLQLTNDGFYRVYKSDGSKILTEILCDKTYSITGGQTYTEGFYFRHDGTFNFKISFFSNRGHLYVDPTIIDLGNGVKFAYATYTFPSDATYIRAIDIVMTQESGISNPGTFTYVDILGLFVVPGPVAIPTQAVHYKHGILQIPVLHSFDTTNAVINYWLQIKRLPSSTVRWLQILDIQFTNNITLQTEIPPNSGTLNGLSFTQNTMRLLVRKASPLTDQQVTISSFNVPNELHKWHMFTYIFKDNKLTFYIDGNKLVDNYSFSLINNNTLLYLLYGRYIGNLTDSYPEGGIYISDILLDKAKNLDGSLKYTDQYVQRLYQAKQALFAAY